MSTNSIERDVRRERSLAARHGYRLWNVREDSRPYAEYGPYVLIDASTNAIVWRLGSPAEVGDWVTRA